MIPKDGKGGIEVSVGSRQLFCQYCCRYNDSKKRIMDEMIYCGYCGHQVCCYHLHELKPVDYPSHDKDGKLIQYNWKRFTKNSRCKYQCIPCKYDKFKQVTPDFS